MENFSTIVTALHALAAVVWVGGMFFAHQVLRPSLAIFEPPQRLTLWKGVFKRFFAWVWVSIAVIMATGYGAVFVDFQGFEGAGIHIHIMHGIGLVMVALFVFLFYMPYPRFRASVDAEDWPGAAGQLAHIRRIVGTNLILGLITVVLGASGRFWG